MLFNKEIEDPRIKEKTGLKINKIRQNVVTAGPSPLHNKRTEVFLQGCGKARNGNPCKGCFNSSTWSDVVEFTFEPVKLAEYINKKYPSKYITIGGGEPLDQIENLIILCRELKKFDYHIMIYTWRDLEKILKMNNYFSSQVLQLLKYLDIIVDGEFVLDKKLWNKKEKDGFLSSIGSSNQIIWNIENNNIYGFAMQDIENLIINNNKLIFVLKNKEKLNCMKCIGGDTFDRKKKWRRVLFKS